VVLAPTAVSRLCSAPGPGRFVPFAVVNDRMRLRSGTMAGETPRSGSRDGFCWYPYAQHLTPRRLDARTSQRRHLSPAMSRAALSPGAVGAIEPASGVARARHDFPVVGSICPPEEPPGAPLTRPSGDPGRRVRQSPTSSSRRFVDARLDRTATSGTASPHGRMRAQL